MARHPELSGDWHGHYEQDRARHGLSMTLAQDGHTVRGTMLDHDTLIMGDLHTVDEELLATLTATDEATSKGVVSSLPAESIVEGIVDGETVVFVKRYQGVHCVDVWVGCHGLHVEVEGHCVHYRGTLSQGGSRLQGEWWIDVDTEDHDATVCGAFEMRRTGA